MAFQREAKKPCRQQNVISECDGEESNRAGVWFPSVSSMRKSRLSTVENPRKGLHRFKHSGLCNARGNPRVLWADGSQMYFSLGVFLVGGGLLSIALVFRFPPAPVQTLNTFSLAVNRRAFNVVKMYDILTDLVPQQGLWHTIILVQIYIIGKEL